MTLLEQLQDIRLQPKGPPYKNLQDLCSEAATEIERLRVALKKIATMQPGPIGEGFVHGPALLLSNCQSEARRALKSSKKRNP